ncbi:hypothetical protein QKD39_gp43 [Psittacine adenovirus 1]|uniref:22K n=1 Tax=Psittacine adenovirus 1 TaxID=318592 RepID=A0A2Z5E036_9ADEN|nr:hypothetical protein QKD39_gp43 [Psittacine adenovirus 1]AXB73017.1 hypothetical protein [Psittacine adenovirus 1]
MAQSMLNEKVVVSEEPETTLSPPPTPSGDIDGDSLGSQDSLSEISDEGERSPSPPLPPKKRRQPSSRRIAPRPTAQKARGKYRSWARYRVIICEALRDAVFDKTKAAQILKRAYGVYVPSAILSYYEKKLTDSFSPLILLSSEHPQADRE